MPKKKPTTDTTSETPVNADLQAFTNMLNEVGNEALEKTALTLADQSPKDITDLNELAPDDDEGTRKKYETSRNKYLQANPDFQKELRKEFNKPGEAERILAWMAQETDLEADDDLLFRFDDWLHDALYDGVNVLTIGWDSHGWGPGGNGCVFYHERFGIVTMSSSDFTSDGHWEVFDESTFEPWLTGSLDTDEVGLSSDIYTNKELRALAESIGVGEDSELTVEGRRGRRKRKVSK